MTVNIDEICVQTLNILYSAIFEAKHCSFMDRDYYSLTKNLEYLMKSAEKKFGKVKSKLVESKYELFNDLIEEVLSASCF